MPNTLELQKLDWKKLAYLVIGLAVAFALYSFLGAEQALEKANFQLIALSQLLFIASIILWNNAWAARAKITYKDANIAGFSSLAGMLTPFGAGTDFLRAYFGRHLHKDATYILATSISVKLYKTALAALLLFATFPFLFSTIDEKLSYAVLAAAAIMFLSIVFLKRALDVGEQSIISLLSGDLGENAKKFSGNLKQLLAIPSPGVIFFLATSLAMEFLAFYFLFSAFSMAVTLAEAFAAFLLLFFASKFFMPQGIGIVEALGFFLLQGRFETALIAGLFLAWLAVRAWIPALLSGVFLIAKRWRAI